MKLIKIIVCFLFPLCSFSQGNDSLKNKKWINYNRKRGIGETSIKNWEDKINISRSGDTLVRKFARSMGTGEVLYETSYIHNEENGLEIAYHPNGMIKEINYYLDGRLWETISRSDSNGKALNPGTLYNGNGTRLFTDYHYLDLNCYETYRNGLPEGPYYEQTGTSIAAKGELTYKKGAVNYLPAKKVTYIGASGEKLTGTFDNNSYEAVFHDPRDSVDYKIIAVIDDSVAQPPGEFKEISLGFSDPAIIPRGNWQLINLQNGKVYRSVNYDDNGNPVKVIAFKENGEVFWEKKYSPCNKRKVSKVNPDGSLSGEFCEGKLTK
ncbi:MAG TPA: hypothetical protein VK563_00490 [Puia sp.]|nr:hypothetical protein [Puia sp.]